MKKKKDIEVMQRNSGKMKIWLRVKKETDGNENIKVSWYTKRNPKQEKRKSK